MESILYVPQSIISESVFLTTRSKADVRKNADDPFNLFVQIALGSLRHSFDICSLLEDGGWDYGIRDLFRSRILLSLRLTVAQSFKFPRAPGGQ